MKQIDFGEFMWTVVKSFFYLYLVWLFGLIFNPSGNYLAWGVVTIGFLLLFAIRADCPVGSDVDHDTAEIGVIVAAMALSTVMKSAMLDRSDLWHFPWFGMTLFVIFFVFATDSLVRRQGSGGFKQEVAHLAKYVPVGLSIFMTCVLFGLLLFCTTLLPSAWWKLATIAILIALSWGISRIMDYMTIGKVVDYVING